MSRRDGSLDVTKAQGQTKSQVRVGDEFEVTPLAIVHGGHGIAHAAGRTIFVRFAIPGELVRIRVTDVNSKACRAEVVEVLAPSALRRSAPCAVFGPGGCGGCDFLHVDAPTQRSWKTEVLIESLARFAGVDVHRQFPGLHVAPLDDGDGLGWRTRIRWSAVGTTWGLHRYRSSQVVPIASCPQAVPAIAAAPQRTGDQAIAWSSADSAVTQVIDGRVVQGGSKVAVEAAGRHWRIRATGFWQVHSKLADVLADAVRQSGATSGSGTWWDLYAGAGLFAWVLAASTRLSHHRSASVMPGAICTTYRRFECTMSQWIGGCRANRLNIELPAPRSMEWCSIHHEPVRELKWCKRSVPPIPKQ